MSRSSRIFPVLAIAFAACLPVRLGALDGTKALSQYAHRIWGQEEGLFQPTVYSILQTRDGVLWLGTQDSLIRFDGVHFREFDPSPSAALHSSLVRDLAQDDKGTLWAASVGSGLVAVQSDGRATHYTTSAGLPSNELFCLDVRSSTDIWACTNRGLAHFDGHSFRTYTTSDGLATNAIRSTCTTPDGTRWVAGLDFGLERMSGSRFISYRDRYVSLQSNTTALSCSGDNSVWLGTEVGLVRVIASGARLFDASSGLPDNDVLSIHETGTGSVWVGTNNGITRIRNGALSVYRTRDGLSHSSVLSLYEDREGSLWAGTKNGLDQFSDTKLTSYTPGEGLAANDIGPVLEDRDKRLWVGTLHDGLNVFEGNRVGTLTTADGLNSNRILSLANGVPGDLWIGTARGLSQWRAGKVVRSFTRRDGLSGEQVLSLFFDGNALWVGTDRGVDQWNGRRFIPSDSLLDPETNIQHLGPILALGGGRVSSLMVSTETQGMYTLREGKPSHWTTDLARPADCFFVDRERGETWMGTLGSGLLRYRSGSIAHVRLKDGLFDNRIYGIVRDANSNFWFASSKGIFRVSQNELDSFADGKISSVHSVPFTTGQLRFECQSGVQPAIASTRDGRLWFSTNNGLVTIDPGHLTVNQLAPPTRISGVLVNGRSIPFDGSTDLQLEPWERNIEIRYAGLSFISPERVTFRYRLNGYEKDWTEAGSRREAFFTNLPSGPFEFEVLARNADGVPSVHPAVLRFNVRPYFYQRRWFFPLLLTLLALIVVFTYRLRVARMRTNFNAVLGERTRIARELHDTLLQGLSGITMQLQALWSAMSPTRERQVLLEIIADAGRCSKEARRSLWGLRNPEAEAATFEVRLARLARESVNPPCTLQLHLQPLSLEGRPQAEYQLLRIVAEILANCSKHAQAHSVEITLAATDRRLRLTISDDGVGFDPGIAPFGHFGLIGIRERAHEIGADLKIDSRPGQGTRITVSLPLLDASGENDNRADSPVLHRMQ